MVISVSHTKLSESVVEFCLSSSLFYPGLSEEHHLCPLDPNIQKGAAKKIGVCLAQQTRRPRTEHVINPIRSILFDIAEQSCFLSRSALTKTQKLSFSSKPDSN